MSHQDDFGDAGCGTFVNHILNQWFVGQGKHFLGNSFTGRQHTGAEAGDRDDCFGDFRHGFLDGPLLAFQAGTLSGSCVVAKNGFLVFA